MSRFAPLAALMLVARLLSPSPVQADDYQLDGSHTSVVFGISHMGYSITYGRFNKVSGAYSLDNAAPEKSQFTLAIDATSIDTNDEKRDQHLKAPDFLSAGEFPLISFKSTKVTAKQVENRTVFSVEGDLTLHGVTRPLTFDLVKLGEGPGMQNDYRTGFNCQTNVKRSEFGMTKMLDLIGDEVAITISFEGVRQGPAAVAPAPGATGAVKPRAAQRLVLAKPVIALPAVQILRRPVMVASRD